MPVFYNQFRRTYTYAARPPLVGSSEIADEFRRSHDFRNKVAEIEFSRLAEIEAAAARGQAQSIKQFWRVCEKPTYQKYARYLDRIPAIHAINERYSAATHAAGALMMPNYEDYLHLWHFGSNLNSDQAKFRRFHSTSPGIACARHYLPIRKPSGLKWKFLIDGDWDKIKIKIPAGSSIPCNAELSIRIGFNPDSGKPIWCVVPFRLSRMPHLESTIMFVIIRRYFIGGAERWEIQLSAYLPSWQKTGQAESGNCGIDFSSLVLKDRVVVATAIGSDHRERTLSLPISILKTRDEALLLASHRALRYAAIAPPLAAWVADLRWPQPIDTANRLADFVTWWRDNRVAGDCADFDRAESWRKADRRLRDRSAFLLRKARNRRDDIYHRFADTIRRNYQTAITPKFLKRFPGDIDLFVDPHRLRIMISSVVTTHVRRNFAKPGKVCHACGERSYYDYVNDYSYQCSLCMERWEARRNSAINILRGFDAFGPFSVLVPFNPGRIQISKSGTVPQ